MEVEEDQSKCKILRDNFNGNSLNTPSRKDFALKILDFPASRHPDQRRNAHSILVESTSLYRALIVC